MPHFVQETRPPWVPFFSFIFPPTTVKRIVIPNLTPYPTCPSRMPYVCRPKFAAPKHASIQLGVEPDGVCNDSSCSCRRRASLLGCCIDPTNTFFCSFVPQGVLHSWGLDGCGNGGVVPPRADAWRPRLVTGGLVSKRVVAFDSGAGRVDNGQRRHEHRLGNLT